MARKPTDTHTTPLKTIDIDRRDYGRRYTCLPVDSIDREALTIECQEGYMQPGMYDLQAGDTVRWLENGHRLQGQIAAVERTATRVQARLQAVEPLPPEVFTER